MTVTPDILMRTYDGKFQMREWWDMAERAQGGRGKKPLLAQFVRAGDLVFDIGANRGVMTLTFRQLGARVVAVEPLFSAAPKLVQEFEWKFGDDEQVKAIGQAVSDKNGMTKISVHKNLPYLSSCDSGWMNESAHAKMYNKKACREVGVKTTTLDALIDEFGVPVFIKIDVEGYESTAIKGLSQAVNALSFEFHQDWLRDARIVMHHLDTLGNYVYNFALDNRGRLVLGHWLTANKLMEHLNETLTVKGKGSWGDIYARVD